MSERVKLLDFLGDDRTVTKAARVSYNNWIKDKYKPEADEKLIKYLAKHEHWSPFAHTQIQLHIKAPIFVARQLAKHQVGASWNEVSRRYVSSDVSYYQFSSFRKATKNKKQGSGEPLAADDFIFANKHYMDACKHGMAAYKAMIDGGVCEEQARAVLPLSLETEWIWTGSLYFFYRVCKDRIADDAQPETREVAEQIAVIMEELYPVSWEALNEERNTPEQKGFCGRLVQRFRGWGSTQK